MLSCGLRPHVRRKESGGDFSPVCFATAHLFFLFVGFLFFWREARC